MKNNFLKVFALSAVLTLSFGVAINVNRNIRDIKEASAYSPSSLPTNVDLNDASDATIRSYYSSLNTLSTNERSGTNLLKNLKPILKNQQKYLSYDSTSSIWDAYCIVDRDWNKSPASSLPSAAGTYNPSTNKILNYKWGGNSSKYENPYLHALYYNRDREVVARAYGDHGNNTAAGINREHIWPKASGFDQEGSGGARGDIMHLWAAHGHTNNKHNRYYYGYVDKTKSYSDEASDFDICSGNLLGKSKTFGGSTSVFEPQDSDKGDIARACFYMVARYNYLSGSDSDGIDANNPNLELVNNVSSYPSGAYTSTTTKTGKLGILQDLLEWNRIDPPDEFEIHRNNLCYNNFTNNRNPFIDFPEWAEYIWGKSEDGDYSSTSTGYATPSSDTINDFSGDTPQVKTLSYITISDQKTSFNVDDTFSFGGTVTAHYSDNTTADVTSSATFSGYNMSTDGDQTVTVSYTEGGITKTTTYNITVNPITLSYISVSGQQTVYSVGDSLDFSGTVTAHYSDGSSADVTDYAIFKGYNLHNEGAQTVTVEYTEGGVTKTTTYDITVNPVVTLSYITVSGQQTVFTVDDDFNFGGTVTAHYSDDSTANVTSFAEFTGYDMSSEGEQTVTVSYTEDDKTETTNYTITVTSSGGDIPTGDASLYTGELTEGDYVIYFSEKAMKNTVSSNRISYASVTPVNNVISQPSADIIWHIAPSGDYWTIYNTTVAKYAAGNGTKNQGALITSVNDYAKWTVSGNETYEFVNKGNDSAGVNKNLRNNGTYGFACYSTSTGDALSLYKVSSSPIPPIDPTSITATVNKTFKVGETITKSDITVKDDLNNTITDFSFANDGYQFTYEDAASGGGLTNKVFANSVTYSDLSCSLTVQVQREAHSVPTASIQHTGAEFKDAGIGTSYLEDQEVTVDGITFNVDGYVYNNTRLSLSSSKTMATGSVINTTPYPSGITNITINGATPDIQLSVNGTSGWVDLDDALVDETNYLYFKIFYKNTTVTSFVNINSITVAYKGTETANSTANYIMYEDTMGQCEDGKFENAKVYFQNMSKEDRQTFMTSDDYVISSARARFVAWATHLGQTIEYVDGDYIVKTNMDSYRNIVDSNDDTAIIVIVIALFTISLFGTLLLIKKKKMR